ncbi:hypothetical protein CFC21_103699 [Triticum aestivum]|uniref:KIB1-4 beta-propeller domain-containing protein n=3 Tax=Triticum TaxID=4564 RepID=A0A9R1C2T9_TRITD|nr:uncharacterized protein LOC123161478 [Triticum aestivum]KAF7102591.1 hypothetical protein CFC21_103699 [Triticum aestivum]VAI89476.1 unnamed protein product [Triticum turgidum subsp. durum]
MGRKAPPLSPAGRKRKGPSLPFLSPCKRRSTPTPAQTATGWASLPDDIARQVAALVLKFGVVDYIAFRAVCSGWRTCAPTPRDPTLRIRSLRPVGWVTLCDGDAVRPDDACQITFFHSQTARCLRVRLPELQRHRIIGFTDGLVILLHKRTTAVRVLNPFTGAAVDFPSLVPVYQELIKNRNCVLHMNAAVCSSVSSTTSIAVVAWFPWSSVVLSADAGHPSWEVIQTNMYLSNTLPFQGQLYGFLQSSRQIVQVYPPKPPTGPVVAHVPQKFGNPLFCKYYLVESDGDMLLVVKSPKFVHPDVEEWRRYIIAIFKVNISIVGHRELIPVTSLGDRALFVSLDRCLSVSSKNLPSISSNSIYLTVSLPDPVVVHCLSSRSFERPTALCQVHDGKEMICTSVRPFTLADHLLTYCNHHEWSNGLMFHEYYSIPESFQGLWKKIRTQDSQLRISRMRD